MRLLPAGARSLMLAFEMTQLNALSAKNNNNDDDDEQQSLQVAKSKVVVILGGPSKTR